MVGIDELCAVVFPAAPVVFDLDVIFTGWIKYFTHDVLLGKTLCRTLQLDFFGDDSHAWTK